MAFLDGKIFVRIAFVVGIFLAVLFSTSSVLADNFTNCVSYTGNYTACNAQTSCFWDNNNNSFFSNQGCPLNYTNYNSSDTIGGMLATMLGRTPTYLQLTLNNLTNVGCCMGNQGGSGGGGGGGGSIAKECPSFNGNQSACLNSIIYGVSGCSWKSNNANQNPGCLIREIGDWSPSGQVKNLSDVGCCEVQGCSAYAGTQTASNNCTVALNGICSYITEGPGCQTTGGCCSAKSCTSVSTQSACNQLINVGMVCSWNNNTNTCGYLAGGGMTKFNNNTDSCLSNGGFFNPITGMCDMGGGGSGGGGGFLFTQEARCWFADNKPNICRNITGCAYCSDSTSQITNASSACYNSQSGFCQGHEPRFFNSNSTNNSINIIDINQSSMSCTDLKTRQLCNCGPLPNCQWSNDSTTVGNATSAYCINVMGNTDKTSCEPPVKFCEDSKAKNNQTLCNLLGDEYNMPCKWDNSSTAKNCTFNLVSCFGGSGGAGGTIDYTAIGGETQCTGIGGTWQTIYYLNDSGSFVPDSWCEKGALFSFATGQSFANKGNCNTDCWACEFNASGGSYGTGASAISNASSACQSDKSGIACVWRNDSNAPNGLGSCDYPKELSFGGAKDCNTDCKACEFFPNPYQSCTGSIAGCSWANDTSTPKGGFCISSSKKSCASDCFSCYDQALCTNTTFHASLNCSWDPTSYFCKPSSFTGEICFNGKDDDNDQKVDCSDGDCTYDQFCGGATISGGKGFSGSDCKKLATNATCSIGVASSGRNCTWVSPTWGGNSYCDYPGSSCWIYETNIDSCNVNIGCIFKNSTGSYTNSSAGVNTAQNFTGFCDINKTSANVCSNSSNFNNNSNCLNYYNNSGCTWINDNFMFGGGRCEFKLFSSCQQQMNQDLCNTLGNCTWRTDTFSPSGGRCEPICFGLGSTTCNAANTTVLCASKASTCEPELFAGIGSMSGGGGGGCRSFNTNYTACKAQNQTCAWKNFTFGNTTQGDCNELGQQAIFEGMDQSPPFILGTDSNDTTQKEIDIMEYGVKDMTGSLAFGIVARNLTDTAVCNGYFIGGGFMFAGPGGPQQPIMGRGGNTTKFYWYLDTNRNTTDGCNATRVGGSNDTGYEFLMKYIATFENGNSVETKSFHRCSSGTWVLTNVPLTSNRQFMCGLSIPAFGPGESPKVGGVMIVIDKENLESSSSYNKSTPMRVRVTSANDTTNELTPVDEVANAGYYTLGTADFKFVDCGNPDSKNDDKCKNFNKFGFNVFEDCKNGKDDDGDGYADCSDVKCGFTPACSSGAAFNFVANVNDKESPQPAFSQIDAMHNGAFIKFDSSEPANGTLVFYGNDTGCSSTNITLYDVGDPAVTFDNFKPFHTIPLDDISLASAGWPNGLVNGTTYYYKTTMCDPSNNCAASACLNFTTKSEGSYKNFIFKLKLPPGYNVSIVGQNGFNYSGNFTTVVSGKSYESGIKANASSTRNMNLTVNCGTQSITFVGVDVLKPKNIDMTSAFVCDASGTNKVLGMNSSSKSWNQVVSDLGMGGYSDYLKLALPLSYSSSNNITWCNDALTNCTDVNAYANCSSGGTGKTDCKIPTSLGFSAYQLIPVSSSSDDSSSTTSGGSSGGQSNTTIYWTTIAYDDQEFKDKQSITRAFNVRERIRIKIAGQSHYVGLISLTAASATINVSSLPQQATLAINESKKFDTDEDKYYDVLVTLSGILASGTKANFTISWINEKMPESQQTPETITPAGSAENDTSAGEKLIEQPSKDLPRTKKIIYIIISVIVLLIIVTYLLYRRNQQ